MTKVYPSKNAAKFLLAGKLIMLVLFLNAFMANAQFTAGRLVVLQVGDGSAALSSAATPVFLKEFSTTGVAGYSVAIPASGGIALTMSGSATSEGLITRSSDGTSIIIPGYNAAAGTATIASTATTAVPRAIGKVSTAGAFSLPATTTGFNTNNARGATSDGTNFWGSGGNTGIVLESSGAGTIVSSTSTNNRALAIYNGNLYFSTGSGTRGIYQVGSGLPTTAGNTATLFVPSPNPNTYSSTAYAE